MITYTQKFDATVKALSRSEYTKKLDPNKVARKVAGKNIADIKAIVIIDLVSFVDCSVSRLISPFSLMPCSVNLCISWFMCLLASFDLKSCIPWTSWPIPADLAMSVSILAKLVSCPYTYWSNLACISPRLICRVGDEIVFRPDTPLFSWCPSRMFIFSMCASRRSLSVRICSLLRSEKSACTSPSIWSSLTLVKNLFWRTLPQDISNTHANPQILRGVTSNAVKPDLQASDYQNTRDYASTDFWAVPGLVKIPTDTDDPKTKSAGRHQPP